MDAENHLVLCGIRAEIKSRRNQQTRDRPRTFWCRTGRGASFEGATGGSVPEERSRRSLHCLTVHRDASRVRVARLRTFARVVRSRISWASPRRVDSRTRQIVRRKGVGLSAPLLGPPKEGTPKRRLAAESPIHGFGVQRAPAPHHQGAIPFLTSFARASPRFASRRLGRSADLPRAAREARGSRWRYARSSFTPHREMPPPSRARSPPLNPSPHPPIVPSSRRRPSVS